MTLLPPSTRKKAARAESSLLSAKSPQLRGLFLANKSKEAPTWRRELLGVSLFFWQFFCVQFYGRISLLIHRSPLFRKRAIGLTQGKAPYLLGSHRRSWALLFLFLLSFSLFPIFLSGLVNVSVALSSMQALSRVRAQPTR